MLLYDKCGKCGREVVTDVVNRQQIIQPCETCLENARAEVRLESSKEMVEFCESIQSNTREIAS